MPANKQYTTETKSQFGKRKALKGAQRRQANEEAAEKAHPASSNPFSKAVKAVK